MRCPMYMRHHSYPPPGVAAVLSSTGFSVFVVGYRLWILRGMEQFYGTLKKILLPAYYE